MKIKLTHSQRVVGPIPWIHLNELFIEEADIEVVYDGEITENEFFELVIVRILPSTNESAEALSIVGPAIARDEDGAGGIGEAV